MTTPITTWIIRLVVAATAALVIGFAWNQYAPYLFEPLPPPILDPNLDSATGPNRSDVNPVDRPELTRWAEPVDSDPKPPPEPPVSPQTLARLGMEDAATEAPPRVEAPYVKVRRVDPVRDRENVGELSRAFDNLSGTVTIADIGPFFEESLRIAGENRVVRGEVGYRPILVLGRPETSAAQARPAAVVLEGRSLVVEGIDFVVDGTSLTPRQESLFLVRGAGSLTLRDCSVTVVGPVKHAYAVVQVGDRASNSGKASGTVRIERSRLRGDASAVRLAGPSSVVVARSAITASNSGGAIEFAGGAQADRSVEVFRSVVASRGPLLDLIGAAGASGARPPSVRSLESTFAEIGGPPSPFVKLTDTPPGPPRSAASLVDWKGQGDVFAGWDQWSSGSPSGLLGGLRGASPEAEVSGRETREVWPEEAADPWLPTVVPRTVEATLAAPLPRLARPVRTLRDRTLGAFPPPPSPGSVDGPALDLKFDADAESDNGDLGRFLARNLGSARRIRVEVSGSGRDAMSPIALPAGVSLEIRVATVASGSPPLVWTPPDGATDEALISARSAELSLSGVRLVGTPRATLRTLLSVEGGNLRLDRCQLLGPAGEESRESGLIAFRSQGSRPFPDRGAIGDRPSCVMRDCILMAGGDAIAADLGSGLVSMENCAIASASNAVVLTPLKVRRDRFDADLVMDRCTIAALDNLVWVKAWPGLNPGPDRPWVIRSTRCVFSDSFARDAQAQSRGVLLRTQVEGLARGLVAWQSSHDVYDLTLFTAGGDAKPLPVSRADVRRSWVDLWGPRHVEAPSGVTTSGGSPSARFLVDRLKPADFEPGDLALDPSFPPGRKALDVGADLARMGIAATVPKFRPR